jgi:hypothetical protein
MADAAGHFEHFAESGYGGGDLAAAGQSELTVCALVATEHDCNNAKSTLRAGMLRKVDSHGKMKRNYFRFELSTNSVDNFVDNHNMES